MSLDQPNPWTAHELPKADPVSTKLVDAWQFAEAKRIACALQEGRKPDGYEEALRYHPAAEYLVEVEQLLDNGLLVLECPADFARIAEVFRSQAEKSPRNR